LIPVVDSCHVQPPADHVASSADDSGLKVASSALVWRGKVISRKGVPSSALPRLVPMLAGALLAVLAASALLPRGGWPDWVTSWPSLWDLVAHLLLLQDVLHSPSLSGQV
jgi:hypothetical protein